ncbi:hypothetical protein F5Y03DRAFT_341583 [Xylaria venustula]|nr:hypothetical protein F5Y03DRAFT_341583 [Xylaria venustula]
MSADLFAAFDDLSQQPPQQPSQQTQSNPLSAQSISRPLSLGSPLNPARSGQPWSQSSSASNQFQQAWSTQPLPALNARPASVATSPLVNTKLINNGDVEDDDGWGDFEVAPKTAPSPGPGPPPPREASVTPAIKQPISAVNAVKQRTRIVRASTLDLISNSLVTYEDPPKQISPSKPSKEPVVHKKMTDTDPNVLFDADDFEGEQEGAEETDDDFGEFETVSTPAQSSSHVISSTPSVPSSTIGAVRKASELLLELDMNEPAPNAISAAQTRSFDQILAKPPKNEPGGPSLKVAQRPKSQVQAKSPAWEDDWNSPFNSPEQPVQLPKKETIKSTWDWDSVELPKATQKSSTTKTHTPPSSTDTPEDGGTSWDWDPVDVNAEIVTEEEDSSLPPINIPPPSILLSAFPQLFDHAIEYLYNPVSGQSQSIKDRVMSDPKVYEFLRGYLALAVVAARIIAGRRLRWHRDKFLSQSMSISSAGSKGMKLAGVDKSQTTREDREAGDVVSSWKSRVGRLRSAVATANSTKKGDGKQLKIPEITDAMPIQTARDVPTAPKACVICGLKRNERIPKIDYEVEDSFGEWWIEHWGHVACKRFWLQHENTLRQR